MSDRDQTEIRRLFDRAMADSPPPVDIGEIHAHRSGRRRSDRPAPMTTAGPHAASQPPTRRRWAAVASVGLIAAAIVAILIVPGGMDDVPRTADDPPASATSSPTAAVDPSPPASAPRATDVADATSETIAVPTTSPLPPLEPNGSTLSDVFGGDVDDPPTVVLAGAVGVERRAADGTVTELDVAAAVAFPVGDGRVFVALASGELIRWDPADGVVDPIELPETGERPVVVHDVAEVAGVVTVLYEQPPETCDVDADECDVVLRAFEPDTGEATRLVTLNGARSRWASLGLADTGIVVGSISGPDGTDFYSGVSGADVTAEIPAAEGLGLTTSPIGCDICPRAYTVDRTGRHVAWSQGTDLVIVAVDDPAGRAIVRDVVPEVVPDTAGADVELDIADVVLDAGRAVAGLVAVTTADPASSVVVNLADGSSSRALPGRATLG